MIEPATSPDAPPIPGPSRRPYRLTLIAFAATLLVLFATIPALRWHHTQEALARLAAAEAEADRLDPGWRLEELEARREKVPDEENAALVVLRAFPLLPRSWPPVRRRPTGEDWYINGELMTGVPIAHQAPRELLDILRGDLDLASTALDAARPLQAMHTGRYPVGLGGEHNQNRLQCARTVVMPVLADAMYKAHTGDIPGAAGRCRQAMAVARAFGDEACGLSALVRSAIGPLAVAYLERVLALGECSDADLRDLQELIRREENTPRLLLGIRGVRSYEHFMLSSERGVHYLENLNEAPSGGPVPTPVDEEQRRRWTRRLFLSDQAWLAGNSARHLEVFTRAVEIAKLPASEQDSLFAELADTQQQDEAGAVAKLQSVLRSHAYQKIAAACQRSSTRLRTADAALAVERYRLRHRAWPAGLDDLIPEFLAYVPIDPYTGQRLSFRSTDVGVVVYSFGSDGRDDGGDVADDFVTGRRATDFGFRLYDPHRRGMLPLPRD